MYLTGQTINGYELVEVIGRGGYGVVYKARHPDHADYIAVKALRKSDLEADNIALKRFALEAQVISELHHPNIVQNFAYWDDEQGAYLAMPLLTGGNLRAALRETGVWSPERVLVLLEQVVSALETAHQRQIIHRDIKPENILFDETGRAYLVDFGLAKRLDLPSGLTAKYDMVGSPAYLAPEQMLNIPVTPLVDIYGLGVVMYEILVGEHPYHDSASDIQMMMRHLREPFPAMHEKNPALTPEINAVIHKAAAKDVPDRYPDVGTLLEAYRAVVP
ncbi:MAG: hypothetical protein OHK0046_15330 [Anaerolineae bacterium]